MIPKEDFKFQADDIRFFFMFFSVFNNRLYMYLILYI